MSKFDKLANFQKSYFSKGVPVGGKIKFVAHLRAYGVYSALYGTSQSAERLSERGGFAPEELDQFYPEWRSYIIEPKTGGQSK